MDNTASELTKDIAYLLNEFNVTIDLTGKQIQEFSLQFIQKIITWEIIISVIEIIISLAIIIAIIAIRKNENILVNKLGCMKKDKDTETDRNSKYMYLYNMTVNVALIGLALICALNIAFNTFDILMCTLFPEKIILEFLSNYI